MPILVLCKYLKDLNKTCGGNLVKLFFRCSRADDSIVSDEIRPKFKLIHDFMYVLVTYKNEEDQMKIEWTRIVKTL